MTLRPHRLVSTVRVTLAALVLAAASLVPPARVEASVVPPSAAPESTATAQPRPKKKRATTRRPRRSTRRATTARRPAAPVGPLWLSPRSASALSTDLGTILSRRDGWGAMVVSITRGDTLFAVNPDALLTPASTLKMFTSVLALDRLGPNWRFSTDVLRDADVGPDGTLRGNLYLRGDGDPSFSKRWVKGTGLDAPVQALAEQVAAAGIKRVTGDVIGDATAFESRTVPEGWLSRYAGAGYAAPFSALSLNENIVVVAVHPSGQVALEPATSGIRIESDVRVVGGRGQALRAYNATDGHIIVRGSIGRAAAPWRRQLIVPDPASYTAGALRAALVARGVAVDGGLRLGATPPTASLVASHKSAHLSELLAVMNRESINHYAELIFRNAVRGPKRDTLGSAENGNALLQSFLADKAKLPSSHVFAADGSGLSVLDRVSPRAMIHMLGYAHRAPWSSAFHASLPVAGESELMRNRMRSTPAAGNLHAKTGTTNDVIGLGGYVTAENGEVLAFSFLFNGRDRWNARATMDRMGATLAAFSR